MTAGTVHEPDPSPQSTRPARDLPGIAERVLIIGLDGATWDVLDPMMERGLMPNLAALAEGGTRGVLHSTVPPITPAAWTTFMTGKSPGLHGILDFERYDVRTNGLSFNTTNCLSHVRTIWQILGDKGCRVGAINVPMTYPPTPVNGFMISGFETPSTKNTFTYPESFAAEFLGRWPDYTFKNKWRRKAFGGDAVVARNIAEISQSFHQGAEVTRVCGERFGWDVLMVVFKLVDNLQHKAWKYIDRRTCDRWPRRAEMVAQCFAELDRALGQLLEYAEQRGAHVFVMSDHGHGSLEGKVQPNLLLHEWGYLRLKPGAAQTQTRTARLLDRWLHKKNGKFARGAFSIEHDLAVDFTQTRACVMHAGMAGFLYVNLKGRQETGIVEPADYEALRDQLGDRFLTSNSSSPPYQGGARGGAIHPSPLAPHAAFQAVLKPEELYHCSRDAQPWMPDLLLIPRDGLAVVRKIRGQRPVTWLPPRRWEGTHRENGIFIAQGKGIAAGRHAQANIIDSTPTILAMLGLSIPDDMEGRVIDSIFASPVRYETEPAVQAAAQSAPAGEEVYSESEADAITERLRALGYLE